MFDNVTALEGLHVTGKYRDKSMTHTCSRHAAWDPLPLAAPFFSRVGGGRSASTLERRRWRSNPSGKCSQERLTRGTVTSTMRRAAHPSGCARRCAGAGCSAMKYQSPLLSELRVPENACTGQSAKVAKEGPAPVKRASLLHRPGSVCAFSKPYTWVRDHASAPAIPETWLCLKRETDITTNSAAAECTPTEAVSEWGRRERSCAQCKYRGTSLIRKRPPPLGPP